MEFEFDPTKSAENFRKHGIDFIRAKALWGDAKRVVVPARSSTEPRFALVAELEGRIWTCIFTLRDERVRIISARRARDEEARGYHQS